MCVFVCFGKSARAHIINMRRAVFIEGGVMGLLQAFEARSARKRHRNEREIS